MIFGCGCGEMGLRIVLVLALTCIHFRPMTAETSNQDYAALTTLTKGWENLPQTWTGADPCGSKWEGITCNNSRIITMTLASIGVTGQLTGDLGSLSELQILDLSYNKGLKGPLPSNIGQLSQLTSLILVGCGFTGPIPESVGSLKKLVYLSLNSNQFTGEIPASIGNLNKLYWLDLSDNKLTGSIPVSSGTAPGLDLLVKTKHFHFGMNQLSGSIPSGLFRPEMVLIHVLFDNNDITGSIPDTLGLVTTLEAVRFDRNKLRGALPTNLNNLTQCNELVLSNNEFTDSIPDLTGMKNLNFLDMSNNSFSPSDGIPAWFKSLKSLRTVMMERTELQGEIPVELFGFSQLETVVMRNNRINGSLEFGSSYSKQLNLVDVRNNSIETFTLSPGYNFTLMLSENPFCQTTGANLPYCSDQQQPASTFTVPQVCIPAPCSSGKKSSPTCKCSYPYTGTLILRAPSFSLFGGQNYILRLQSSLLHDFQGLALPVESVSLSDASVDNRGYLNMLLSIFPQGQDHFNRTGIFSLGFVLSNQTYKPTEEFGPYVFIANSYTHFEGAKNSSRTGLIVGAVVGVTVLFLLLLCAGGYAYRQKKRAERAKKQSNPFVSWDSNAAGGDIPTLKGARYFTFEELQKCTNNFSESNNIGAGGYGKVYKGYLADGQIVAIKRSQEGSMQGSREFKNEIELLSRVHHKNLVNLLGFCFDQGEQMLVYEFIPNGTLMDSLSGKSGIQLDWIRRVMVTLGSARGLQYLHELADPPIIHRDIKSNNILLDERLNAKVADFGLSKPFGDSEKGYVTTQVKGTMGYLDPEYFMTNQLTEKSDVFSFGVVMMEMVTARRPIQQGKYIVKEIKNLMDYTKDLYGLHGILDPVLLQHTTMLVGMEKFVDLAFKCVDEAGANRPTMGEVVKELEDIIKLAGMNPNADSAPVSQTYEGGQPRHPYSDASLNAL